jgi:prepilin-type N-terminal cleavage/methylation domain-containing protein
MLMFILNIGTSFASIVSDQKEFRKPNIRGSTIMKIKSRVINGRSGFTLIELIVGMAILGIVAGFAIPHFAVWIPGYHLKNAARDVYSSFQLARLEAVKRNTDCVVTRVDANTYKIDIGATTIKTVSLGDYGKGITLLDDPPGTSSTSITFTSKGMASFLPVPVPPETGKMFVTNSDNTVTYTIRVTATGVITLK